MKTNGQQSIRIGVLDNDVFALDSVTQSLRMTTPTAEIWATAFPTEALQRCMNIAEPTHLLLVDMALQGVTGPQIAARIHVRAPRVRLVGMTSYDPAAYLKAANAAGIVTVLDKAILKDSLPGVLRDTIAMRMDDSAAETATAQSDVVLKRKPLTATEQRVVALSLGGLSNKQIGSVMHISADTVSSHRRNIKGKLCVDTWLEALDVCRELHTV